MGRINWTNQAVKDLKNIFDFISTDSKFYAKREISKIKLRSESLKQLPLLGRVVPEFNDTNIRELIEGKYRIVYRLIDSKDCDILTIHHASRDIIILQKE